jgi:hypothetical protein
MEKKIPNNKNNQSNILLMIKGYNEDMNKGKAKSS